MERQPDTLLLELHGLYVNFLPDTNQVCILTRWTAICGAEIVSSTATMSESNALNSRIVCPLLPRPAALYSLGAKMSEQVPKWVAVVAWIVLPLLCIGALVIFGPMILAYGYMHGWWAP